MELVGAAAVALIFLGAFAQTFYREVRRTPWDLVEALVLFAVIGHAIAIPISLTWKWVELHPIEMDLLYISIVGSLVSAMFMTGGAVWVFRRLHHLGEKRRGRRIGYLLLGLLLFPSMTSLPIAACGLLYYRHKAWGFSVLVLCLLVWMALFNLNMLVPSPSVPAEGGKRAEDRNPDLKTKLLVDPPLSHESNNNNAV